MSTQNASSLQSDSEELHRLCTSTDIDQVRQGFQLLGNYLYRTARKKLNTNLFDDSIVEDCVQLALLDIWKKMEKGEGAERPASFLSWATRIVQCRCLDRIRYEKRRRSDEWSEKLDEILRSWGEPFEHQILLTAKRVTLLTSLRQHSILSKKSKIVLVDGIFFEKTDSELAHSLLTPQGNIRLIRHRNLDKLRHDIDFIDLLQS